MKPVGIERLAAVLALDLEPSGITILRSPLVGMRNVEYFPLLNKDIKNVTPVNRD